MFQISTGRCEITPRAPEFPSFPLAGYTVETPRRATGIHRPLYARCAVLWDAGTPRVIVTLEVLAVPRSLNESVRAVLNACRVPVAASDLVIASTHTHNGPALSDRLDPFIAYNCTPADLAAIDSYTAWLSDAVVSLIQGVVTSAPRQDCQLKYTQSSVYFSRNRAQLPYIQTRVPVLAAQAPDGQSTYAVFFGYGCHPVCAGVQSEYDPDYPGAASAILESRTGAMPLFLQGAAGDQDPSGPRRGWVLTEDCGKALATVVEDAMKRGGHVLEGPIVTRLEPSVDLPLDITDTPENMAAVREAFVNRTAQGGAPGRHAEGSIAMIDSGEFPTAVPLPVQVWKLSGPDGGLRLVLLGGEVVSGYDIALHSRIPGSLWVAACCNEVPCYIPSDELLKRGSTYEGGRSSDAPGIGGGNMIYYNWPAHFLGGEQGAEATLIGKVVDMAS